MAGKLFDIEAALDRVADDRELLLELIEICLSESERRLEAIKSAIETNDPKKLDFEAHAIKSALGNVGAMSCHAISSALERHGKDGNAAAAMPLYEEFVREIGLFKAEYEKFK